MNGTLGFRKWIDREQYSPAMVMAIAIVDGDDCFVDEQLYHRSITAQHGYEQKQSSLGDSDDGGACFMEE